MIRRRRRRPEQEIQRAVIQHLHARGIPNSFAYAVPNGGWRTAIEGAILKGQGVVPGVPDLAIVAGGRAYYLELKSLTGTLSVPQEHVIEALRAAGAQVAVTYGLDDALKQLEQWGLLRGKVG